MKFQYGITVYTTKELQEKASQIMTDVFNIEKFEKITKDKLTASFSVKEINELLEWYNTDLHNKIIQLENHVLTMEGVQKRKEFVSELQNLQIPPHRLVLLQRFEKAAKHTDWSIQHDLNRAIASSTFKKKFEPGEKPPEQIRKNFSNNRDNIEKARQKDIIIDIHYTYHTLSDENLKKYTEFSEKKSFQKFNDTLHKVLDQLIFESMELMCNAFTQHIEDQTVLSFDELNFKYSVPGHPWAQADPLTMNPNAKVGMMYPLRDIYFIIMADIIGSDINLDNQTFLENTYTHLKKIDPQIIFYNEKPFTVNGLNGVRFEAKSVYQLQYQVYSDYWICMHNGIAYQLICYGYKDHDFIQNEFNRIISNFELIDRERIYYSKYFQPFESYASTIFGYKINLKDPLWQKRNDIKKIFPSADTGGLFKNIHAFFIIPFFYGDKEPHLDILTETFMKELNIKYPDNQISNYYQISGEKDIKGCSVNFINTKHGDNIYYQFKILIRPQYAYLISVSTKQDTSTLNEISEQVYNSIQFDSKISKNDPFPLFTDLQKQDHARFNNSIGLNYFLAKQYKYSLHFFKAACELDNKDEICLSNAVDAYVKLGQDSEGLTFLESRLKYFDNNSTVLSCQAMLLRNIGKTDDALSVYKKMFSGNYRNNNDFFAYIHLLAGSERWVEIESVFEKYLEGGDSLKLRLKQAEMRYQHGQYKSAVELLKKQQENIPFNADIAFAIIRSYNALRQPQDVLDVTREMIRNGLYLADAYYLKGNAEYQLKMYHQAKQSFEKYLEYEPNDQDIREIIKYISAILSEGI